MLWYRNLPISGMPSLVPRPRVSPPMQPGYEAMVRSISNTWGSMGNRGGIDIIILMEQAPIPGAQSCVPSLLQQPCCGQCDMSV